MQPFAGLFNYCRVLCVLLVSIICCFSANQLAAQAVIAPGSYQLVPANNGANCVDIAGPSKTPGAVVQLYTCGNPQYSTNQVFMIAPIQANNGTAGYQLLSTYSNQCIDVDGVSVQNGAHLQQYTCGGAYSLNQIWTFTAFNGSYEIVSANGGACLDIPGGNEAPGSQLQQWACGGGTNPNQLWKLIPTTAVAPPPVITPPAAANGIPATFFGMGVINSMAPMQLTFGAARSNNVYPDLTWGSLEGARGFYNFTNLDMYINANTARGTDMIYTFSGIPNWASADPTKSTPNGSFFCNQPANMSDWDDYVTAIVKHSAGRIRYWEVWNEPQYSYCGNPATLVTMAQHLSTIAKSIDPNALIISPAGTTGGGPAMLTNFFSSGGAQYVDIIGCHGYGYNQDEQLVQTLASYQQVMHTFGVTKPLWDTESDFNSTTNSGTSAGRAAYVAKSYLIHQSMGIERFYWYGYDTSQQWGGLTAANGALLPEAIAYQQVRLWMLGATMSANCAVAQNGMWSCALTRLNGYRALALWNPSYSTSYTVPAGYTNYRDLSGGLTNTSQGSTITIANQPILLESSKVF